MLTQIEAALLKARGYSMPDVLPAGRQFRAIAIKDGKHRAEALGSTRDAAARNLVLVITRR